MRPLTASCGYETTLRSFTNVNARRGPREGFKNETWAVFGDSGPAADFLGSCVFGISCRRFADPFVAVVRGDCAGRPFLPGDEGSVDSQDLRMALFLEQARERKLDSNQG